MDEGSHLILIWLVIIITLVGTISASTETLTEVRYFHMYKNITEAREYCVTYGGHLLTVKDQQKLNHLKRIIQPKDLPTFYQYVQNDAWLDLSDTSIRNVSNYVWVSDGADLGTFHNWAEGEPTNQTDEKCVRVKIVGDPWKWFRTNCSEMHKFVCEKEIGPCGFLDPVPTAIPSNTIVETCLSSLEGCKEKCRNITSCSAIKCHDTDPAFHCSLYISSNQSASIDTYSLEYMNRRICNNGDCTFSGSGYCVIYSAATVTNIWLPSSPASTCEEQCLGEMTCAGYRFIPIGGVGLCSLYLGSNIYVSSSAYPPYQIVANVSTKTCFEAIYLPDTSTEATSLQTSTDTDETLLDGSSTLAPSTTHGIETSDRYTSTTNGQDTYVTSSEYSTTDITSDPPTEGTTSEINTELSTISGSTGDSSVTSSEYPTKDNTSHPSMEETTSEVNTEFRTTSGSTDDVETLFDGNSTSAPPATHNIESSDRYTSMASGQGTYETSSEYSTTDITSGPSTEDTTSAINSELSSSGSSGDADTLPDISSTLATSTTYDLAPSHTHTFSLNGHDTYEMSSEYSTTGITSNPPTEGTTSAINTELSTSGTTHDAASLSDISSTLELSSTYDLGQPYTHTSTRKGQETSKMSSEYSTTDISSDPSTKDTTSEINTELSTTSGTTHDGTTSSDSSSTSSFATSGEKTMPFTSEMSSTKDYWTRPSSNTSRVTTASKECRCRCATRKANPIITERLRIDLAVGKTSVSRFRRTKVSVADNRRSVQAMGAVSILVMAGVALFICLSDITRIIRKIKGWLC